MKKVTQIITHMLSKFHYDISICNILVFLRELHAQLYTNCELYTKDNYFQRILTLNDLLITYYEMYSYFTNLRKNQL